MNNGQQSLSNQARAQVEQQDRANGNPFVGGRGLAVPAGAECAKASPAPAAPVVVTEIQTKAIENFAAVAYHLINKQGKAMRAGWNGKGMHVEAQFPDFHSEMGRPYLFTQDAMGVKTPWVPSQGDLFATDWALLPDNHVHYPF